MSALASPILYTNMVAGCLLLSSTQPNYFMSESRLVLISDYAQLIALAFHPEQFVPPERIELRLMPPVVTQRELFATFPQRVITEMKSCNIARAEAEQLVWQQIEKELIHIVEPTLDK